MSKVFNMVGGGGKNISSIIISGLESTDTINCTKDGKSYTATWDSTAQHWEIVGLPLGTFTVTATNGTKTITETVLIDIAGVYEIEMDFKLWLYRYGNECEDVTGGFTISATASTTTITKQDDSILINYTSNYSNGMYGFLKTANTIDLSKYSSIRVIGTLPTVTTAISMTACISDTFIFSEYSSEAKHEFTIDISGYNNSQQIEIGSSSPGNIASCQTIIYAIWLE